MAYWSRSPEEIFREFNSSINGLSDEEVEEKQKQYGFNDIPMRSEKTVLKLLVSQLKDLFGYSSYRSLNCFILYRGRNRSNNNTCNCHCQYCCGFRSRIQIRESTTETLVLIRYSVKVYRENRLLEVDTRNIVARRFGPSRNR